MKLNTRQTLLATAVSLALSPAFAGIIDNSNDSTVKGRCAVTEGAAPDSDLNQNYACIGAWDLGNVNVKVINLDDETETPLGVFDEDSGAYPTMGVGTSFVSEITDVAGSTIMARLTGKDWPVGEPTGIKVVNNDPPKKVAVSNTKCNRLSMLGGVGLIETFEHGPEYCQR